MLKKANISLIDGYIRNTLIIEGRTTDGDCSFNQKRVLYNIDSSAVISYKISYEVRKISNEERAILGVIFSKDTVEFMTGDRRECIEILFFI